MNASVAPESAKGTGYAAWAVASLALGVVGLLGSVLLLGGLLGVIGIAFGAFHLARRRDRRGLAWTGVAVSALAMVASVAAGVFYFSGGLQRLAGVGGGSDFSSWVGKPAPEMELTLLDGQPLRLSDLKGRRVVVDFWATWCPPCLKEIPHFVQLSEETSTNDLVILGVSAESEDVLKKFVEKEKVPYSMAGVGGVELEAPYSEVRAIPTTFFLDREGRIEHVAVGYRPYDALRRLALGGGADGKAAE